MPDTLNPSDKYPITFVGAGPGDPELITVKGQRAVAEADLILYAGSLVPTVMLGWAKAGAEAVDTAGMDLDAITACMVEAQRAGRRVVRLHTGDPSLYGAIQEQMQILDAEAVPYRVIPGVTAAFAAAAALGRELTLPEITQTLILTRAAGRTPVPEKESLAELARPGATLVIYLSIHLIDQVTEQLAASYGWGTPAVVAYRVSWPDQKIVRGTLRDIAEKARTAGIQRQALIMVGPTLAPSAETDGKQSKLYDKTFSHGFRAASDD